MSDFVSAPPPPPPPPPPVAAPASQFDFLKPFTFLFDDPNWLTKTVIGALFYVAALFLIGIFFVFGYFARLARNVVAGVRNPMPEWDDLGGYFSEGAMLFAVGLVYALPVFAIVLIVMIPAGIIGALSNGHENDLANIFGSGMISCAYCLIFPISLALGFWMPAALLFAALERRFGAAFEFRRIFDYLKGNFVNYLLAFIVTMVARFAASLGFILLCIGVFWTAFIALCIATYAYADAYRLKPAGVG